MCVYMHPPNGASAAPLLYQESYIIEPVSHTELKHEGTKKLTFSQALNKKVNKLDSFLKESFAFSSSEKQRQEFQFKLEWPFTSFLGALMF